jgi:hypothetical protein
MRKRPRLDSGDVSFLDSDEDRCTNLENDQPGSSDPKEIMTQKTKTQGNEYRFTLFYTADIQKILVDVNK